MDRGNRRRRNTAEGMRMDERPQYPSLGNIQSSTPPLYKKSKNPQNTAKILGIKDYYAEFNRQNNNPYLQNQAEEREYVENLQQESFNYNTPQGIMQAKPYNSVYQEMRAREKRYSTKWLKVLLILFIIVNIALFATALFMDAYVASSKAAKKAEHERIVNNHPLYYRLDIEANAREYNLQPALISAIIKNESSFNPEAQSNVGALGLMQLMPDTAEWISGKVRDEGYSFQRMADPEKNIKYGSWYLNFLSKRFNDDVVLVVAAYHAGQGTVSNWLKDSNISHDGRTIALENLPDGPTKTYVRRVYKAYAIYDALYFKQADS